MLRRWRPVLAVLCGLALAVGCAPAPVPSGVVVPPDAVWELVGGGLDDMVGLVDAVAGAGLLPVPPGRLSRFGLESAGLAAPVAVAGRGVGGIVVTAGLVDATRLQTVLTALIPDAGLRRQRVLGQVDALLDEDGTTKALLRAGNGVLVVVLSPDDALAEAVLAEALATGAVEAPRRAPRGLTWRLRVGGPLADVVDEAAEGSLVLRGRELVARGRAPLRSTPGAVAVRTALAASAAPMGCVADDVAVLTLHLPAVSGLATIIDDEGSAPLAGLPGGLDAFEGRLTLAVLPPPAGTSPIPNDPATLASLAIVGRPRSGAATGLRASVDEALVGGAVEERTVGARVVRSVGASTAPWRRLSVLVDDDVFAVGLGAGLIVDRVAAGGVICPQRGRVIQLRGPAAVALLERAAPEMRVVRRLAAWTGTDDPLAVLAGIDLLGLDASPSADGTALDLQLALTFGRTGK
jgi:hypothetical protein